MAPPSVMTSVNPVSSSNGLGDPTLPDLRVVAVGGGTGLPTVLRSLRAALFESRAWDPERDQTRLTAIATVADDGSSSGNLRAPYRLPSPGDIRNCLLALAGLDPANAAALPEAVDALEKAHLIVIGPGSLYSSLVATLLPRGLPEAITRSRARVVHVMNLMTQPGETDGHTGVDHLMAIRRHAPTMPIHDILVNAAPLAPEQVARYGALGAAPVPADAALLKALGHRVVEGDLLGTGDEVRHDPAKLGRALLTLAYRGGSRASA